MFTPQMCPREVREVIASLMYQVSTSVSPIYPDSEPDDTQIRTSKMVTCSPTKLLSGLSLLINFVGFLFITFNRTWIGIFSKTVSFLQPHLQLAQLEHLILSWRRWAERTQRSE